MSRVAYLAIVLLPNVLSQTTSDAICSVNSLSWTFNSLGASPCQVAADLGGVCNDGVFSILPLDNGFVYSMPPPDTCYCNTVFYSLVSACAACQDRTWSDWADYVANCSATSPGVFPMPIPVGTRVPGWAYADVRVTGTFNLTVAESLDLRPESIGTTSSTSSSTLRTSSTSLGFGTISLTASSTGSVLGAPATSPTSGHSGSSSGSNAGAIAGGVIGGVFGLALIGGITFCFLRRRRPRSEHQPPYSAFNTIPYMATLHNPDQNMSSNPPANPFTPVTPTHQTLYDTSDPSMFPSSAPGPASSDTSTFSPLPQAQSHPPSQGLATQVRQHPPQMQIPGPALAGRYTGVPEL